MTREEAIKELSYIADEMPSMECGDWKKAIYMAIKALEQEPCEDAVSRAEVVDELNRLGRNAFKNDTDYDNFFAFLDSLQPVTSTKRWIPVSEKLPEEHGEYLVTDKYGRVTSGLWIGNAKRWKDIIAWMPLPEPYKAESEE